MSFKIKSLLALTSVLVLASTAHAAPKMDANGDGEITRIEYMSFQSNAFNKGDKNFDGKLTKQEIRDSRAERNREAAKKRFKGLDTNGDGNVTLAEMEESNNSIAEKKTEEHNEAADKWFDDMDEDKNGNISRLEYNGFLEKQMGNRAANASKTSEKTFKRMDLDGDGIITETEYVDRGRKPKSKKADPLKGLYAHETAKPKKRTRRDGNSDGDITKREDREYNEYQFDRLDKNKDGVITKKEARYLFQSANVVQRLPRH